MALHTYTPTEWKNAPDHKTTPINATNLNNIETGIENAYTDISGIDSVVADKAEKDDLTNISETGATASQAISVGTYFYLEGTLVRAKTAIASGATFILNTNYEVVSAGALNNIGSRLLWENPSPNSSFAQQTIAKTVTAMNVSRIIVFMKYSSGDDSLLSSESENGKSGYILFTWYFNGAHVRSRQYEITLSGTSLSLKFYDATSDGTTKNDVLIPYRVYGVMD